MNLSCSGLTYSYFALRTFSLFSLSLALIDCFDSFSFDLVVSFFFDLMEASDLSAPFY